MTLKLQNGAVSYFVNIAATSSFDQLAEKLTEMVNRSGGFIKNLKPVPIEQAQDDVEIPKTSFDDSSDEEVEDVATTDGEVVDIKTGVEIEASVLKFAVIPKGKGMDDLKQVEDTSDNLAEYGVSDYSIVLFALLEDEYDYVEPNLDRDD